MEERRRKKNEKLDVVVVSDSRCLGNISLQNQ